MTKEKKVKNRVGDKSLTITRNIVRIFLVIWTILILFPLFWAILSSLKTNKEFAINAWTLPAELQWVNYKNAWLGANFSKYFANSLMLSVGTVILSIIMTTSTAYVVGKFVHPVVKGVEVFYSVFMMVPQVLLLIPLLQMCKKLNMTKDDAVLFTLMLTNALQGVPFYVFLLTPFVRSINNSILEAAEIDGASRWKQTIHVTIPGISYIIVLNLVLSLGGILGANFDQIFNMYNPLVYSTGDVIDTWVYRQGLISFNYGVGTAVGLFRSVIAMVLTIAAYWGAYKFADYKIF
mgnify:CR=1 FL=1